MRYAEQDTIQEMQRRREQLITYLHQWVPSSDAQAQKVIALLEERIALDDAKLDMLHRSYS